MIPFIIQAGEAASFQEYYQRLVETWLRELVDKESLRKPQEDEQNSDIRITDRDKVVYGQIDSKQRHELTPRLIGQLEKLQSTPVGGVIEGAGSKIIEVDGQVVLQSAPNGQVIVNSFWEKQQSKDIVSTLPEAEQERESKGSAIREVSRPPQGEQLTNETSLIDSHDAPTNQQFEGGLERVRSSVEKLTDSSLQQMLSSQLSEMRTSLQQHLSGQQQRMQALEELVRERLHKPKETNWWQRTLGTLTQAWATLSKRRAEHSAAASLKTLFHSQVPNGGNVYQADHYTIHRQGRSYTLCDKSGATLMQFQSTPMGVRVEPQSVQLSPLHYQEIQQLGVELSRGEEPSGAFAPVGAKETEYFQRVNTITAALSRYAAQTGSKVQVEGKFAYRWLATPDGKVRIDAKDGRGALLVQAQGQLRSRMSDRDLAHFEQLLPILNSAQRVSRAKEVHRQPEQVAWERN